MAFFHIDSLRAAQKYKGQHADLRLTLPADSAEQAEIWRLIAQAPLRHIKNFTVFVPENVLADIPDFMGDLVNLELLDISGAGILSRLPSDFSRLSALQEFRLLIGNSQQPKIALPAFAPSKSLKSFWVNFPIAGDFSDFLLACPKLKTLGWLNAKLENLPDCFEPLKSLFVAVFAGNQLRELPPSLLACPKLYSLDISDNPIERLPAELWAHKELHTIALENTKITHLGEGLTQEIAEKSQICEIQACRSPLRRMSPLLWRLPHLYKFSAYPLEADFDWDEFLTYPDFSPYVGADFRSYYKQGDFYFGDDLVMDFRIGFPDEQRRIIITHLPAGKYPFRSQTDIEVWKAAEKAKWEAKKRQSLLKFLPILESGGAEKMPSYRKLFLNAYNLPIEEIFEQAEAIFEQIFAEEQAENPMTSASCLAIAGDFHLPQSELLSLLKPYFAQVAPTIRKETTHILLGYHTPNGTIQHLQAKKRPTPINWAQMLRFIAHGLSDMN